MRERLLDIAAELGFAVEINPGNEISCDVTRQDYPHILVTAGLTDPRVTYWEPTKWVAKLRALKTDKNILVLKMNMSAGHAGASGRFDYLKEVALMYAFLLKVFGMAS